MHQAVKSPALYDNDNRCFQFFQFPFWMCELTRNGIILACLKIYIFFARCHSEGAGEPYYLYHLSSAGMGWLLVSRYANFLKHKIALSHSSCSLKVILIRRQWKCQNDQFPLCRTEQLKKPPQYSQNKHLNTNEILGLFCIFTCIVSEPINVYIL